MTLLYVLCYLCVAVFLIAVVARAMRLLSLPIHMRWELYPVAHEKKRAHYGGSYLEEHEWWTKSRESSKLGELKVMVPEILLLEGVREKNPTQWRMTWPFHFGLYLLIGATVLMILDGLLGVPQPGGFFGTLVPILGYAGIALALFGSATLLGRRLLNADYREYTTPLDFVNLAFFVLTFVVALIAQLSVDPSFLNMRGFFHGLVTWDAPSLPVIQRLEVVLFAILVAYVPLTHMSHFFTKYFMYHDIRWGDEPMNEKLQKRVESALGLKPTWSAPHIGADGEKTWVDVATSDGKVEDK